MMKHDHDRPGRALLKGISSSHIAMAFTGSFLGAGFVSGQELTQFFAAFGGYGLLGMVAAVLMLLTLSCLAMKVARQTEIIEFEKIVVRRKMTWLRAIFGGVFIFFLFGVVVVMTAGAGALVNQVFGIPKIWGRAIMAVCLALLGLWEAQGVLNVFRITVPCLIVVAMITSVLSFFCLEGNGVAARPFSETNPLLGNWLLATVAFVSYNMMVAISILVPIAPDVEAEKTIGRGIFQGAVQLLVAFVCILLPLILNQTLLAGSDLPMLTLAERIAPVWGIVYAVLLLCGMFGSGLACLFGVTIRIKKIAKNTRGSTLTLGLVAAAFIGSLVGFKELIATVFPVFGYIGFLAMIGIVLHYFALRKEKTAGILVLTAMLLSLWSTAVWAGVLEYPLMPGPGGVGGKINSLFDQISQDLGETAPASPQPAAAPVGQPSYVKAYPTSSNVIINGTKVPFEAYTIDNRTYFKLRDLAMVLKVSDKQFEVSWDGAQNAINLLSGQAYTVSGGELALSGNHSIKNAVLSTAKVYINGTEATLTAYVIDGRTYFKLRDLGAAINFGLAWDGAANTISINTAASYVPE